MIPMVLSWDVLLYSKACLLGWMVAIPVGPVGLLIVQRSIKMGSFRGILSGLGAALADGLFGLLAALGLSALIAQLEASRHFVRPLGSLVLMIVGTYFYFQKPPPLETDEVLAERYVRHHIWDLLSTFFLTLLNPLTIIAFAALFAGSDLIPEDPRKIDYVAIMMGVFSGSLLWWSLLVVIARPIKRRLSPSVIHRTLQIIGLVLIGLALVSFIPRVGGLLHKIGTMIG